MKTMTWLKLKFTVAVGAAALFAGGVATVAISQTSGGGNPVAQEIIRKSQDAYASLTSYSDEGITTSAIGETTIAPHIFSIKLARTNLYRIEWKQDSGFFVNKGVVWSTGKSNLLTMDDTDKPQKFSNMETALSAATGISGSAAASIPGTFFKLNWGNRLGASMKSASSKPDDKIGDVDCYVLTHVTGGRTQTLWIGKQDYFIRQIQTDTPAAVLKALLDAEAKKHPEVQASLQGRTPSGDSKSVETHTNIVVNQTFSPADFVR